MKKLVKFVTFIVGFRYILKILSENVDVKIQIEKLRNEIANLETDDLENKLKDFFKKYDPKFKDLTIEEIEDQEKVDTEDTQT